MSADPPKSWPTLYTPSPHDADAYVNWLFVHSYEDLRKRVVEADLTDRYAVLGISPLLRKLILDGDRTLAHAVHANSKASPLRFSFTPFELAESPHPEITLLFSTAWYYFGKPTVTAGLREFLGTLFGQTQNSTFTVKEYVLHYAHVEGGVHWGKPVDELDKFLIEILPADLQLNMPFLNGLVSIGVVVLDALQPTYLRLRNTNDATDDPAIVAGMRRLAELREHPARNNRSQ